MAKADVGGAKCIRDGFTLRTLRKPSRPFNGLGRRGPDQMDSEKIPSHWQGIQ